MNGLTTEPHPLGFFLPENARILMLGSFPPPRRRWSMEFYYPNLQNDMWRIFGLVFFDDRDYFMADAKKAFDKDRLVVFLREKGIALGDTAREVVRLKENASDQFLEIVTPIDLAGTLYQIPACRTIVTTGQKATDTLLGMIDAPQPPVGGSCPFRFGGREMRLYRMPSSSRAYPKPVVEKAEIYKNMFRETGLLGNERKPTL